jgi:hypothetical protein
MDLVVFDHRISKKLFLHSALEEIGLKLDVLGRSETTK